MKRELMDILACPLCKGSLTLSATKEEEGEIVEGSLRCESCGESRALPHPGHHSQPAATGA